MSEVCPTENASLRLDKRFLAKSPAQLAVCLLWTFLRRSLSPMDVYCKTFPAQRCLPDGEHHIHLRNVGSHPVLS